MKHFYTMVMILLTGPALAAENIQVWGRAYNYSCGYFSRQVADLSVTFQDYDLPFGTKVNLIAGFAGTDFINQNSVKVSWGDRQVVAAQAISTATWEARLLDKTLHLRSESRALQKLQFVLEVKRPGEDAYYVNGGGAWGFFETESLLQDTPCVQNGRLPVWRKFSFE